MPQKFDLGIFSLVNFPMQKITTKLLFLKFILSGKMGIIGVDFDEVTVLSTLKYKVTNHVEQQTFIDKMGGI